MVKSALRSPYTIIVIALMLLVVGLFSMARLPMDILPTIRIPAVMVVTTYTGMPAEMIETDITNRLERWLSQASGLDHIESRSLIGVSILNCFFEPGFDPNNALAQISTLVMSDLHYLPPGTQPPIVMAYDPTANLPVALLSIFSPGIDEAKLWDESNYIVRNQLNAVPGAVAPVVFGGKQRQIMVYMDRHALSGHHLSPLDVVDALKRGNAMIPTGDAKIGKYDFSISSNGMVPRLEDFDNIPIKVQGGSPVFIKDIGKTVDASAVQSNAVQVNGVKETYVPLFRRMGSNTLSVVQGIKDVIPKVLNYLPERSDLHLIFDQSKKISEAVGDVIRELVVGVLLAAVVIYFFLGSAVPTVIAGMAIPLSIIGCMIGLFFTDQSLNLMTLGGLALVTGPLIDMAVVVLENIERHLEMGKTPAEAAEVGASEVTLPVLVSTLALIIVFFPVTFFQGLGKFLFSPMALAVAIAVLISFFTAMTLVPLAAARFLKSKESHAHHKAWKPVEVFNQKYFAARTHYEHLLAWVLDKPKVIIGLVIGVFVASLFLIPLLGNEFFPVTDHGQFFLRMRAESGTRLELTTKEVSDVSETIRSLLPKESVEVILANSGVISSWAAAYSPNSAAHDALLEIQMNESASMGASDAIEILRPALARRFPDTGFSYSLIDPVSSALNYGALTPLDLRVIGPELAEGQKIATELLGKMRGVPGVVDPFIEQELNYPSIHIEVDRIKSAYLGLATDHVIKNIITALNSSVLFSPNFWDDPVSGNNYFIGAMYPEEAIDSKETIANIPLNETTLLRNVAQLSRKTVPVEISHYNIKRTFDVLANVSGRDIGSVSGDIDQIVSKMELPKK
ncbi:MAG: efflux RND transporter permease subunit, partial [Bdellovibrionota bacterium]